MRILWEIFTLVAAIGVILGIAKGFPGFGRVLAMLFLNPIGLVCLIGIFVWISVIRSRRKARMPTAPPNHPNSR